MDENEFSRMKAAAMEQMREMNSRSAQNAGGSSLNVPPFVRMGGQRREQHRPEAPPPPKPAPPANRVETGGFFKGLDLPFLDRLKTEGDLSLVLGLLLILLSEKADKKLLFALLYILL